MTTAKSVPRSAYDEVGGMKYLPRTLDKIRLHAAGKLREDFQENLGTGGDGWCCDFLRVNYEDLKKRVAEGKSDEEILEWCFENGRRLNAGDVRIWNNYITKVGCNDFATRHLAELKKENGLGDRDEIQTMAEFFEYDEGRKK